MKIKLSKTQWELIGKKTGWIEKEAFFSNHPLPFYIKLFDDAIADYAWNTPNSPSKKIITNTLESLENMGFNRFIDLYKQLKQSKPPNMLDNTQNYNPMIKYIDIIISAIIKAKQICTNKTESLKLDKLTEYADKLKFSIEKTYKIRETVKDNKSKRGFQGFNDSNTNNANSIY